jgi:hypothetical protein
MTPPDGTAATWRDLADQLTPEEREVFEDLERDGQGRIPAHVLLDYARHGIDGRVADMAYGDVPAPAAAARVGRWEKNLKRDGWSRSVVWRSYSGGAADLRLAESHISVEVDGHQQCDGSFTRRVSLWGVDEGGELTSDQARAVAALLTLAADELDRIEARR